MIRLELLHNSAMLVSLAFLHSLLVRRLKGHRLLPVIAGCTFGAVTMVAMMTPVTLRPGLIFDGRSIILSVAGLFGGPVTALIATLCGAAYRIWLGGVGTSVGLAVIAGSALIGSAWRWLRQRRPALMRLPALYLFGLLVHLWMLLCMTMLPSTLVWQTLSAITLPVLLIYPLVTLLICVLFLQMERHVAAEEALEQERNRLWATVQAIPDLLFELGLDGHYYACYARESDKLAAPAEQLVGRTVREVLPPEAAQVCLDALQEAQEQGQSMGRQFMLSLPQGEHWFELSVARKPARAGQQRFMALSRDITARKQGEAALCAAKRTAEEASRAKSEFLANMSHEIRTPLNGVLGMVQLLAFTELTQDQREYLDCLELSSKTLLALINDILDLSKIEAGKLQLSVEPFSLRETIAELATTQGPLLRQRGLPLRLEIDDTLPELLLGDQTRVAQILLNLLGNAIKFTRQGEIVITARPLVRQGRQLRVHCTVTDTGIGMEPEMLERIFAPFEQGDVSTTRRYGGTGLGLAICQRLVTMMGGNIWAESRPGEGSTFHLELPFEEAAGQAEKRSPPPPRLFPTPDERPSRTILVAEDNRVNASFITALLGKLGYHWRLAGDGKGLVALWEAGGADGILMDIQLPEFDGLDAAALIRRREQETGGHIPIIALTAHALYGDRERFLAAGFDGYLSKPLDHRLLAAELHRLIHPSGDPV